MITGGFQRFTLPPEPPEHGAQGLALIGLLAALSPAVVLVLAVPVMSLMGFVLAGLVAATAGIAAIFFGYIANQKNSTFGSIAIVLGLMTPSSGSPSSPPSSPPTSTNGTADRPPRS